MRNIIAIVFAISLVFSSAYAEEQKEKIIIVADTWCPYNCNPKSPHPGFIVDIAKTAFAKHNIDVEYRVIPWAQAISDTRKGKYAAIIAASSTDAPDFIFPSIKQGHMENFFYVKKGNSWRYKDIKSLKDVIIGVVSDYSYNEELDNYIKKYRLDPDKVQPLSGDKALEINVSKLSRGKIGATVEAKFVMEYFLSQNHMKDLLEEAGSLPVTDTSNLYIAFSPKNRKLSEKYAEILSIETNKMRESGELAQILDTYDIKDWEK